VVRRSIGGAIAAPVTVTQAILPAGSRARKCRQDCLHHTLTSKRGSFHVAPSASCISFFVQVYKQVAPNGAFNSSQRESVGGGASSREPDWQRRRRAPPSTAAFSPESVRGRPHGQDARATRIATTRAPAQRRCARASPNLPMRPSLHAKLLSRCSNSASAGKSGASE